MSLFINPALISQMQANEFSCYYSPAPFGLPELKSAAASAYQSVSGNHIAAAVTAYGFSLYNRITVSAVYATQISGRASLGLSLSSVTISIKNYGNATAIYPNAGITYLITDEISWGAAVQNLTNTAIGKSKAHLPVLYHTGLSFGQEELHVFAAIEKESLVPLQLHIGSTYRVTGNLELLIGYSGSPAQLSCGFELQVKPASFIYALSNNPELGYSHQLGLRFIY